MSQLINLESLVQKRILLDGVAKLFRINPNSPLNYIYLNMVRQKESRFFSKEELNLNKHNNNNMEFYKTLEEIKNMAMDKGLDSVSLGEYSFGVIKQQEREFIVLYDRERDMYGLRIYQYSIDRLY